MQYKEGTLGAFLRTDFDLDFILNTIYSLDSQMKQIHKRGYCLKCISLSNIVFDEYSNITFSDFYKITDSDDIIIDINDFNNMCMGLFVLNNSKQMGCYSDISYFDYSVLAKRDREFIYKNYVAIRSVIPRDLVEYYDSLSTNLEIRYLTDFIKVNDINESNKNNTRTLVKATAVGRALADKENNIAAFAAVLVYPVLAFCGILLIILTYLLYIYL